MTDDIIKDLEAATKRKAKEHLDDDAVQAAEQTETKQKEVGDERKTQNPERSLEQKIDDIYNGLTDFKATLNSKIDGLTSSVNERYEVLEKNIDNIRKQYENILNDFNDFKQKYEEKLCNLERTSGVKQKQDDSENVIKEVRTTEKEMKKDNICSLLEKIKEKYNPGSLINNTSFETETKRYYNTGNNPFLIKDDELEDMLAIPKIYIDGFVDQGSIRKIIGITDGSIAEGFVGQIDSGYEAYGLLKVALNYYNALYRKISVIIGRRKQSDETVSRTFILHELSKGVLDELTFDKNDYCKLLDVQELLKEKISNIMESIEILPDEMKKGVNFDKMEEEIISKFSYKDKNGRLIDRVKVSDLGTILENLGIEQSDFKRLKIKQYKKIPFVPFQKREYMKSKEVIDALIKRNNQITSDVLCMYRGNKERELIKYSDFAHSINLPQPTSDFFKKLYSKQRFNGKYDQNGEIISIVPGEFYKLVHLHTNVLKTAILKL